MRLDGAEILVAAGVQESFDLTPTSQPCIERISDGGR